MNTLHDYDINPSMGEDMVIIRIARKEHRCAGDHDGKQWLKCNRGVIDKGSVYIEYLGESPAYASGERYHVDCAHHQGLLVAKQGATV